MLQNAWDCAAPKAVQRGHVQDKRSQHLLAGVEQRRAQSFHGREPHQVSSKAA